jgi:cobalamin biosynthesis protein CbiD
MNTDASRTASHISNLAVLHITRAEQDEHLRKLLQGMAANARQLVEAEFGDPTCSSAAADARLAKLIARSTTHGSDPASVDGIRQHLTARAAIDLLNDELRRAELRIAATRSA